MNTKCDQSEIKISISAQVKKEYQSPKLDEFGSLAGLTAGGLVGTKDDGFTGTSPI